MRYTKYFGQVNKDNGLQRISNYQLGRIMNIAFLEGQQRSVKELSRQLKAKEISMLDFRISNRIGELTGNKEPRALMEEICYLSEKEL